MGDTIHLNPILRFPKIDCRDQCIKAWRANDVPTFVKFFVYWHLDRDGVAKFPVPLTRYIHELTGLSRQSIQRARRSLVADGYFKMKNVKKFEVEKFSVNRVPTVLSEPVDIPDRDLSKAETHLWEVMTKLSEHTRVYFMDLVKMNEELCQENFQLKLKIAQLQGQLDEREHAEERVISGYEQGLDKGLAIQSPNGKEVSTLESSRS